MHLDTDESLPDNPGEITTAWLTEIFSESHPGTRARKVEVVEANSGTTGRARIQVAWEGGTPPAAEIFAKLPPTDETSRQMVLSTGMGRREARFYQSVAASVPVRVPAPLWARSNEEGSAYIMLLEDLLASGCRFPSTRDPKLLDHARSIMNSLGRLHARYHDQAPERDELHFIEPPMRNDWGRILLTSALEQFDSEMPGEFRTLARLYLEATDAFHEELERGPHTLLHGDPHLGNLFLDGTEIGFLDWACTCRGVGVRDVAYFVCNSMPTELRRENEVALLDEYRRASATGGIVLDADEVYEDYRRFAAYAWIAAVTTLAAGDRMQSVEVGRRATARANLALRDLGTVDYFQEVL